MEYQALPASVEQDDILLLDDGKLRLRRSMTDANGHFEALYSPKGTAHGAYEQFGGGERGEERGETRGESSGGSRGGGGRRGGGVASSS